MECPPGLNPQQCPLPEETIDDINSKIKSIEWKISNGNLEEKEKERLWEKEKQLREKEKQLRERELLELKKEMMKEKEEKKEEQLRKEQERESDLLVQLEKIKLSPATISELQEPKVNIYEYFIKLNECEVNVSVDCGDGQTLTKTVKYIKKNMESLQLSPFTKLESSIVRECYEKLYTKFIGLEHRHILLTGNPGIGKSWFLYYMMYRLIKGDKSTRIFYTRAVTGISFFISDGKMLRCSENNLLKRFHKEQHVGTSYYFFDCGFNKSGANLELAELCDKTLVVSSPNVDNYKDYWKFCQDDKSSCRKMYMPPWTWHELKALNISMKEVSFDLKYSLWGGIPRRIFASDADNDTDNGASIYADIDLAILQVVDNRQTPDWHLCDIAIGTGKLYSHKVYHIQTEDFFTPSISLASPYVSKKLFDEWCKSSMDDIVSLINSCCGQPLVAAVRGQLFEQYAHTVLSVQKKYKVRCLSTGDETDIILKPSGQKKFDKLCDVNSDNEVYYYPSSRILETIDSILPPNNAFQITVSYSHSMKHHGLDRVKRQLGCKTLRIYFVVPIDVYENFKKQSYLTTNNKPLKINVDDNGDVVGIEQYVLRMDVQI